MTTTTTTTTPAPRVPARLRRYNQVMSVLLRLGLPLGPLRLLTVTGRRTGVRRTTPIATFTYEGGRYVMQGWPGAAWVANARAAGRGQVGRGPWMREVTLIEVPVEERRTLLRHVAEIAPASLARTFVENGLVASADPESFVAAAPTTAVFRIERAR
jgi:deazaflavin-dependent oxidoreductase (nitroreductase family)